MERLKLKDYVKRGTNVHPKHKRDLIYLILPLLIVLLVGSVAVISPRIWSGKPYKSKQLIFSCDLTIKKTWAIEFINRKVIINGIYFGEYGRGVFNQNILDLATNDGLSLSDFESWFGLGYFKGQIICWNDKINYDNI